MSLDPYHFHAVLRQQSVIRAERNAAEAQAGRIAGEARRLGRSSLRAIAALRRAAGLWGPLAVVPGNPKPDSSDCVQTRTG